jgi:DNA-binding GntR family transcriptional regulator
MRTSAPGILSLPRVRMSKSRLQDDVFNKLRDLILNGEIAAGQLITVQALSDAFGVSAMPIREALQRLVAAQALTTISGRSIGIPPLTRERLLDLTRTRLVIEGAAAEWAVDRVTPAILARLEQLASEMRSSVRDQDVKRFLRHNREFHFTIYKLAGSESAYTIIEGLWLQVAPYFHHLYKLNRYAKASDDHDMILKALKTGDQQGAGDGVRADIRSGSELLLGLLAESAIPHLDVVSEQPWSSETGDLMPG